MRTILLAAAITLATPAFADEITGTVLAFDRYDRIIVLDDKTVWELGPDTAAPAHLSAGDRVRIVYEGAGEDGIAQIEEIEVLTD